MAERAGRTFHPLARRRGRAAHRRRRRGDLRGARLELRERVRVRRGPDADPAADRSTGVEERRSYSICAPVGARPRVGVREIPDGRVLAVAGPRRARRRRDRGADAERAVLSRPGVPRGRAPPVHRRRLRHHADAVDRRHRARQPGARRHAALRQPHHRLGDVRRGARRPQEPLRPAARSSCTCSRASPATSSCSPAASTPTGCAGCSTALVAASTGVRPRVAVRPVRDDRRRPGGARRARRARRTGCTSSCSTSTSRRPSCTARMPSSRARPATSPSSLDGRTTTAPMPTGQTILDAAPADRATTCRSPARAASAAPAARWSATARSTCAATTPSTRTRSSAASC